MNCREKGITGTWYSTLSSRHGAGIAFYSSRLLDLLFPPLCHSCKTFIPGAGDVKLCASCLDGTIPLAGPICNCCGHPFATSCGNNHLCGPCSVAGQPFLMARSAFRHDSVIKELIHGFKYGYQVKLRRPLALLAAPLLEVAVAGFKPDMILPVPLHPKRLRQRGFNQSLLLAELFAKKWQLPLSRNNLRRIRWTEPQINLSATEREENVKGAFAPANPEQFRNRRLLVVDDVYTTGSTVKECSRVLSRDCGATVAVLTVARAVD